MGLDRAGIKGALITRRYVSTLIALQPMFDSQADMVGFSSFSGFCTKQLHRTATFLHLQECTYNFLWAVCVNKVQAFFFQKCWFWSYIILEQIFLLFYKKKIYILLYGDSLLWKHIMIFDETKIKNIFENSLYGIMKAVNLYLLAILLPQNKRGATDSQVLTPRKQR